MWCTFVHFCTNVHLPLSSASWDFILASNTVSTPLLTFHKPIYFFGFLYKDKYIEVLCESECSVDFRDIPNSYPKAGICSWGFAFAILPSKHTAPILLYGSFQCLAAATARSTQSSYFHPDSLATCHWTFSSKLSRWCDVAVAKTVFRYTWFGLSCVFQRTCTRCMFQLNCYSSHWLSVKSGTTL